MPRPTPPAIFFFANIGWGASTAYMLTVLPVLLRAQGLPMAEITALLAVPFVPLAVQPLWAPILDAGGGLRLWFLCTSALAALASVLSTWLQAQGRMALLLYTLLATNTLYALASAALSLLCVATVRSEHHGRASGLLNAGSMVSTGLLGTVMIELAQPPPWLLRWIRPWPLPALGLLVGALLLLSALPVLLVIEEPEPLALRPREGVRGLLRKLREAVAETLRVMRGRDALLGLLTCLSPVGTAAAANLLGALGPDYGASTEDVALATGVGSALAMAVGALLGGFLADRADRRAVYLLAGAVTAGCALAMATAPATRLTFMLGALAYAVATGLVYGAFYPFMFTFLGVAAGVGTRYGVFTGASNLAIYYVTTLEGGVYQAGGAGHLLGCDAALNLGGALLVILAAHLWPPRLSTT